MSFAAISTAIRSRFMTEFPSLQTQFENEPPESWGTGIRCVFDVKLGETLQVEMASPKRFRAVGVAYARLFDGMGRGDGNLLIQADLIASKFRSVSVGGVVYASPSVNSVGLIDEMWVVVVEIPFHSEFFQ